MKVCPETGEPCSAINCNISEGNCYRKYAREKNEEEMKADDTPDPNQKAADLIFWTLIGIAALILFILYFFEKDWKG